MILIGLPTCETCRKALAALRAAGCQVGFRDLRSDPLSPDEIDTLLEAFGERLVNRASATWRGLSEEERSRPAAELVALHPAVMKRPVIADGNRTTLGWGQDARALWS